MEQQERSNNTLAMVTLLGVLGISFVWAALGFSAGAIRPASDIAWLAFLRGLFLAITCFAVLLVAAFMPIRRRLAVILVAGASLLFFGAWHLLLQELTVALPLAMEALGDLVLPIGCALLALGLFGIGRGYQLNRLLLGSYRKIEHSLATRDQITQLFNRRYFYATCPALLSSCQKLNQPCVLAVITVDNLPVINHSSGVSAGDAVLTELGRVLFKNTRRGDIAARLGGRSLALFLPDTPLDAGLTILERVLTKCEQVNITDSQTQQQAVGLTLTHAIELADNNESFEALVERCQT